MGRIVDFLTAQGVTLALDNRKKMLAFDREFEDLEAKVQTLQSENQKLRAEVRPMQQEIDRLKDEIQKGSLSVRNDNPQGYRCDHCGSPNLKRIGNRPNPTFGRLGTKDAVFRCNDCQKESSFIQE